MGAISEADMLNIILTVNCLTGFASWLTEHNQKQEKKNIGVGKGDNDSQSDDSDSDPEMKEQ